MAIHGYFTADVLTEDVRNGDIAPTWLGGYVAGWLLTDGTIVAANAHADFAREGYRPEFDKGRVRLLIYPPAPEGCETSFGVHKGSHDLTERQAESLRHLATGMGAGNYYVDNPAGSHNVRTWEEFSSVVGIAQ